MFLSHTYEKNHNPDVNFHMHRSDLQQRYPEWNREALILLDEEARKEDATNITTGS